jgi:coenzyme F420-dependent glucose-6-phosphate dehydrogenase
MTKIYMFCSSEQFQPEALVEHAVLAEKAGFDGIMISEHFHPWVDDYGASGFTFSTLGAIAARTKKIHLMTAVITPLFRYHPAVVAQAAATIDRLSGGRFELGIGSGENINESPLGFSFPGYQERSQRIIEAIEIISGLLSGTSLDFNGKFYTTKSAKLYSPPIGEIPILLAAGGPQTASLAAKYCDGIMISVKDIQEAKNLVAIPTGKPNAKFLIVANRWSIYAQDDGEAWTALRAQRGLRAPSRAVAGPIELQAEADNMPRREILNKFHRIKTAKDYIDTYGPLITELGADIIGIQTTSTDQLSTIAMIGKEVLPHLRKLRKETR